MPARWIAATLVLWAAPAEAQSPAFEAARRFGPQVTAEDPVVTGRAGTWLMLWASTQDSDRLGPDLDIVASRTDDQGRTWTQPFALTASAATDNEALRWITDTDPTVATDGRGTWVAAWQAWGGRDARDVLVAVSEDDGRTFDPPVRIRGPGREVVSSAPQIATDGRGVWIVTWTSQGGDAQIDYDVFLARSVDGGRTWSSPVPAAPYTLTDDIDDLTPRVAADGRGTWIIAWSSAVLQGPDYDVAFIRSRDDGRTWSTPALINADAASDGPASPWSADDFAPSIAADGQGTWVATWSSDKLAASAEDSDVFTARSIDNGATWSVPRRLTEDARWPVHSAPWVATDARSRWVIGWAARDGTNVAQVFFRTSDDGGATFAETATVPFGLEDRIDEPVVASDGVVGWVIAGRVREAGFAGRVAVSVARGTCGNGQIDLNETCDAAEADSCCTANCVLRAAADICRPSADPCDVPEACDGRTAICPDDGRAADGTVCGPQDVCIAAQTCSSGVCVAVPRTCDDGDPCTADACDPVMGCTETPVAGCCVENADCDDGNPCTLDQCGAQGCVNEPIPGCCVRASDCEASSDPCTVYACIDQQCQRPSEACTDGGVSTDAGGPALREDDGCGCRSVPGRRADLVLVVCLLCAALATAVRRVNSSMEKPCAGRKT